MDIFRVAVLRARASHEYSQQILHDTRIQVSTLQQQILDLQQQLITLKKQHGISRQDTAVTARAY
jgi:hypothetical protein